MARAPHGAPVAVPSYKMLGTLQKAKNPMLVTLLGMVTEVNPLQPQKAQSPMVVTLLGMVTEVNPLQPQKAQSPMLVTLFGMTKSVKIVPFIYNEKGVNVG